MSNAIERLAQSSTRLAARMILRRESPGPLDLRTIHRVLVVRVDDRVGNVLLTTPLMRALREGLPHARLDWLIAAKRQHIAEGLFLADKLIGWDKARSPTSLASTLWRVRRVGYDLAIDASHFDAPSTTSALITRWTGAPVRVGFVRPEAERFFTHPVQVPENLRYDVAAKLRLLEPLGLPERGWELETTLGAGADDEAKVKALLTEAGIEAQRFFVVNPGARKLDRRMPTEQLGELVAKVANQTRLTPLVVWGPGEKPLAEETARASGGVAKVAPPNDLPLLAALLRKARLLITNDTGPMHLGVACGAPVLALFLQADATRWGHPIDTFKAVDVDAPDLISRAVKAAAELVAASPRGRKA